MHRRTGRVTGSSRRERRAFAEALTYLPEIGRRRHGRPPHIAARRGCEVEARRPGDREPQRHDAGRMDPLRVGARRRRSRRDRAQPVYGLAERRRTPRPTSRRTWPSFVAAVASRSRRAARGEDLHRASRRVRAPRRRTSRPRGADGVVLLQPLLPARRRSRDARTCARTSPVEHISRARAFHSTGSRSSTVGSTPRLRRRPACTQPTTSPSCCSSARMS